MSAWAVEQVADFTPGWGQVHLGFLSDGTCCIAYIDANANIHEATRAVGETTWTDSTIRSSATILAADPGDLYYWHYAASGSTRALAYATARNGNSNPAQLWLGTNTGGGWSWVVLNTYTEAVSGGNRDVFTLNGVGLAVAEAGTVGVLTTVVQSGTLNQKYTQAEFWSGGLTILETINMPSGRGSNIENWIGDSLVVDSGGTFHALWSDTDPVQSAWPYEVKYAPVGGSVDIIYSDENIAAYGTGLVLNSADDVFAFYRLGYTSSKCVPIGSAAESLAIYDNVSGAVKGGGLNAAGSNSYDSHLIHLTRTSSGTWTQSDIVSREVYLCEMATYNSKLYIAFMDADGVWLARQAVSYSIWQAF